MRFTITVICCLLLIAGAAFAQADRGTLTGTIADPAGAVIPGAAIALKNINTGAVYQTVSSSTGNYTFAQLPAGKYQLSSSVPGFKQFSRTGITVMVAQILRVDIMLEVGDISETVTVSADAPLLRTESGELGQNVRGGTLNDLPILGFGGSATIRNPFDVTQLVPGAYYVGGFFSSLRVNGAPANTEGFRIEGQDATNTMSLTQTAQNQPSVDAIEEFAIQTSNYSAEYGQAGGGFFNVTMKSGTNKLHGTAYDYIINEALNAAQPYTGSKNAVRRHNYGFTVGGPVWIPNVYDGHDKTFFFFNWEQFRENTRNIGSLYTVPTLAYRAGDFSTAIGTSRLNTKSGTRIYQGTLYEPGTEHTVVYGGITYLVRDPYTNNQIPVGDMDPISLKIQDMIPTPNNGTAADLINNYVTDWDTSNHRTIPSVKIDHNIGSRSKISGYWSYTRMRSNAVGCDPWTDLPFTGCRQSLGDSHTVRINYDYAMTPATLLHLGAGFHTLYWRDDLPIPPYDQEAKLGIPQPEGIYAMRFPRITGWTSTTYGGSLASAGPNMQSESTMYKPTANASVTWVKSNHTYKFGAEMRLEGYPTTATNPSYGFYTFSARQTGIPDIDYVTRPSATTTDGFGYASFLLGYFNNGNIAPVNYLRLGRSAWAFFAQDSWKVTRKFTLDYGLRYDYQGYLNDSSGRLANFNPILKNPNVGDQPGAMVFERYGYKFAEVYPYAFGPRLGAAYQITPKTVFRAGFGITYGQTASENRMSTSAGSSYPFEAPYYGATWRKLSEGAPESVYAGGYPFPNYDPGQYNQSGTPVSLSNYFDHGAGRPPRIMQWSIGLQREITQNLMIEASYVGNRGVWWEGNELISVNALSDERLAYFGLDRNNAADLALLTSTLDSPTAAGRTDPRGRAFSTPPYATFPLTSTVAQSLRPYPQFTNITNKWSPLGKTWYDSLQAKVTKRFSHGLDFVSSFTWQQELSMGTNRMGTTGGGSGGIVNNVFDRRINKYLSTYSRPYVWITSLNYTLPKLGVNPALSWAIRDWTIGAVLNYSSGMPLAVPAASSSATSKYNFQGTFRNRVPGEPLFAQIVNGETIPIDLNDRSSYDPFTDWVLNPNAWEDPALGQFGTSTGYYGDFRQSRSTSEKLSIGRVFRFAEGVNLSIRADFDNILNRMNLGSPSTAVSTQRHSSTGNTGFGAISTSNLTGMRSGIFVARITF
jgi:hypothetical protein